MKKEGLKTKSTGIVLSGGGIRGMAHIGLFKALAEHEIYPDFVSGTSVGAIVGALYANGHDSTQMLEFFRETPLFKYNFLTINKAGFIDTERYISIFREYFPADSFEALSRKLFVTSTNLQKGTQEVFSQGPLIKPLLASAALPPVFSPVEINHYLYADGGIMNNFPSEPLKGHCEYIIGSNVSVVKEIGPDAIRSAFQLTQRTTALMIYAINNRKIDQCDLLFEPRELEKIGVLDKKSLENAFQIGYRHACQLLEHSPA